MHLHFGFHAAGAKFFFRCACQSAFPALAFLARSSHVIDLLSLSAGVIFSRLSFCPFHHLRMLALLRFMDAIMDLIIAVCGFVASMAAIFCFFLSIISTIILWFAASRSSRFFILASAFALHFAFSMHFVISASVIFLPDRFHFLKALSAGVSGARHLL